MSRFNKADVLLSPPAGSRFNPKDAKVDEPRMGFYERLPDEANVEETAKEVFGLSTELGLPLDVVEFNYNEMVEIADPDDVPQPEEPEEGRPLEISTAPEEKSLLKSIFGYEGVARPDFYWNMNPVKKAAFDVYMAGRHILTRIGGKIVTETGIANTKEVHDLFNDELINNPKWYQKSPELLGWGTEKAAEFYALKGLFMVTGLHGVLSVIGLKLAKPFMTTAIVRQGGSEALKTLSKEGLKRLGKDSLVAFLRFAPENTAFLTTWSAAGAALKGEDKTEAAWSGALWGAGLSVVLPVAGGVGKVFLETKAGAAIKMVASRAYTELWRKFPRLMNAGKRPFSDEFLTEAKRQFRARFGIEPTAAQAAQLKKVTRLVGDEITKAAQKEAAVNAYWNSGAKKAHEVAKEAIVKPTAIAKKAPRIVPEVITPAEGIKPPTKPIQAITAAKKPPKAAPEPKMPIALQQEIALMRKRIKDLKEAEEPPELIAPLEAYIDKIERQFAFGRKEVEAKEIAKPVAPVAARAIGEGKAEKITKQLLEEFSSVELDSKLTVQESMGFDIVKEHPFFKVGTKGATEEEITAAIFHETSHLEEGIREEFLSLGEKDGTEISVWQDAIERASKVGFSITPEIIAKIQPRVAEHTHLLNFQAPTPSALEPAPPQELRLGEKEAGATTIIPDITTEVSETGKRLGSTIKGAITGARELYSRNVKRYSDHLRSLGEEGKSVAKDFDEITQRAQKKINNSTLDARAILKGVNKENREKIAKTINNRLKNPPKWIQQRADKLRDVLDQLLNEAKKLGIQRRVGGIKMEIAGTGKAFPQVLNADGEKLLRQAGKYGAGSPDVLAVAEEMVAAGKAKSVESYVAALQHFRDQQLRGISGYLERERIELPERFLEFDPDRVLSGLFQKNWLFIEGARQWGVDAAGLAYPKMAVQIEAVRAAHGSDEAKELEQFVKAAFGRELLSSEASRKISGAVRGYQFLTKIALSPLTITRNMLDRFNKVMSFAPLSVQLKTLKEYPPFINAFLKHSQEIEEEMIRRGAVFSNTAIGEGYQPGHLLTRVAGKAFASSELGNQIYIAQAKKNAIDANLRLLKQNPKIAKIFDKRIGKLLSPLEAVGKSPMQAQIRLRELGNEEMLAKIESVDDISPDLLGTILHKTVRDNAFPVVLSTKRSWWDNKPFIRMLTQFKVWGTDQVGHIWNDVIKDTVKHRDPSKMIGWIVSMAVTGEIYNILRDFILGRDESLLKTLSDSERRNARDISITILKDIVDGGAVGILADIIYGLPNLIGGPSVQTLINMGDTTAKTVWNPTQAKDALKQLAIKETPALRQTQSLLDKIDARYNQKNLTQDYYKWRRRAWEWSYDRKFPKATDKAKEKAIKALLGWTRRVPQERTFSYEMITRNILVGDTEKASDFLFFLLKKADTPREQESIERGIQSALRKSSPLGNVAEEDLGEFFSSMTSEQQREAMSLQLQWKEWNRDQSK